MNKTAMSHKPKPGFVLVLVWT